MPNGGLLHAGLGPLKTCGVRSLAIKCSLACMTRRSTRMTCIHTLRHYSTIAASQDANPTHQIRTVLKIRMLPAARESYHQQYADSILI